VQCFGDSLLSHEEYLHSHKWRAVNKSPCGEPQSPDLFLQRRQRSGERDLTLLHLTIIGAIDQLHSVSRIKEKKCLAYLWLAQLVAESI